MEQITEKFIKEDLEFYLPETFKGLTKKKILDCIFNDAIQSKWKPAVGDMIVGKTGNVFVIGGKQELAEELGGELFFFGGNLCSRNGSPMMNETSCGTMNESGKWIEEDVPEHIVRLNHSSYKDFRFVPYPHETDRM